MASEGLQAALLESPDLIVLDLSLPQLDGFSVLARLREAQSPSRVLILTARGQVEDRVKGLKAGADDYLAKPFSMDELMARIDALGRRGLLPNAADILKVGDLANGCAAPPCFARGQNHSAFTARIRCSPGPDAGSRPDFFAHRALRTNLASRSRIRHAHGGDFHHPIAQES